MSAAAEPVRSVLPLLAVLLPLVSTLPALRLAKTSAMVRMGILGGIGAATAMMTVWMIPAVLDGVVFEAKALELMPEIWIHFRVDAMGALFGATVSMLWLLVLIYSDAYLKHGPHLGRYYAFLMLCLALTMGVAYAGNLFTLLVFYELFSIMTYPLVVHEETPQALAAGTKYIVYVLIGGSLALLGVIVTYFLAGNVVFGTGPLLSADLGHGRLLAVFWCFVAGFGVKAALVPLHGWVPDAHPAAPAPFSALLSGVMVAAGAFGFARVVFDVFGPAVLHEINAMPWVSGLAVVTVLLGAVLAINQDDLKRRLAYSTISQMGYVMLAFSILSPGTAAGGLVHITHHAFMKGALFLCAGLAINELGIRTVSGMAGLARRMPVTAAAFSVAAIGLIGTPPLAGFVSKWVLGLGMIEADRAAYIVVLLGGALLAAVYLMPIIYTMYFREPADASKEPHTGQTEAPLNMLIPTVIAAALTLVLGLAAVLPGMPLSLARLAAAAFFP